MDLTLGADNILRLNIPVNDWGPETGEFLTLEWL